MALFRLHNLGAEARRMLYVMTAVSTHHPTSLQPCGMVGGALKARGEALYTGVYGRAERVNSVDMRNLRDLLPEIDFHL